MTKKHFEMIAEVLRKRADAINYSNESMQKKIFALYELRNLMYHMAEIFAEINNNFDTDKFYSACEVQTELEHVQKELGLI